MRVTTLLASFGAAALPLLIPLLAMQLNDEVQWTAFDFAFAWILLFTTGLAYIFISKRSKNTRYRAATTITVLAALLLVWANGAVGLIGSENNPANLLYGAVLLVLVFGSLIANFKARGMAHVAFAAAIAQLLVPIVAFLIWHPPISADLFKAVAVSGFFAVLWIGAGLLYRRAE